MLFPAPLGPIRRYRGAGWDLQIDIAKRVLGSSGVAESKIAKLDGSLRTTENLGIRRVRDFPLFVENLEHPLRPRQVPSQPGHDDGELRDRGINHVLESDVKNVLPDAAPMRQYKVSAQTDDSHAAGRREERLNILDHGPAAFSLIMPSSRSI